jgi:fatty acid desaturase
MQLTFTDRSELKPFEWAETENFVTRVPFDRDVVRQLSQRSNWKGLVKVILYFALLIGAGAAFLAVAQRNVWLSIPLLYFYWMLYGFLVAPGHELQHKIVFAKSWEPLSEVVFFLVQTLMWNSPRYARISHMLHHRCTMVRNVDPETDWPEVVTTPWLRRFFIRDVLSNILVIGVVRSLPRDVMTQVRRIAGRKDRMMRDHCDDADIRRIRLESLWILSFHVAVAAVAIAFQWWALILMITIAWQVGAPIEGLWHHTEHIGRMVNVNDQRLCTRSIKVGPFIKFIYFGLDDHVDHHLFPPVPSYNLPTLHELLKDELPEPRTMLGCWKEMFAIAREKTEHPRHEYVPTDRVFATAGPETAR